MERAKHSVEQVRQVVHGFQAWGDFIDAQPYGSGHINDTYKVSARLAGTPVNYLVQRINHAIFKQPDRVMANILRVTEHVREKFEAAGDSDATRKALTVIPARDGLPYVRDEEGNWWRMYLFIEQARTYDIIESERQAFEDDIGHPPEGRDIPTLLLGDDQRVRLLILKCIDVDSKLFKSFFHFTVCAKV